MRDPLLPVDALTGRALPEPTEVDRGPDVPVGMDPAAVITYLQGHRRAMLRALRASTDAGADYWRWQGHAELSRQLLERLGAEVPQ